MLRKSDAGKRGKRGAPILWNVVAASCKKLGMWFSLWVIALGALSKLSTLQVAQGSLEHQGMLMQWRYVARGFLSLESLTCVGKHPVTLDT